MPRSPSSPPSFTLQFASSLARHSHLTDIPTMQPSLKEDLDQYTNMTLWEMTRLSSDACDEQDFANAMAGSSTMSHNRSISSESISSSTYAQQNTLTRTHPSLNYRTGIDPSIYLSSNPTANQSVALNIPTNRESPPSSYRRRGATPRSDEEPDELPDEPLDPNASEQVKQAYKRRRNTLAARRSRQRRQAQFQKLEEAVARLNRERDIWKERALMMERMLSTHGLPCPNFAER